MLYNLVYIDVLIETYWNVKALFWLALAAVFSINRNILECKVALILF